MDVTQVGGQGDGLAEAPGGGLLYVPLTLAGERARVRVEGQRAEVVERLTSSAERVAPPCPHFGVCGGCALQHWADAPYLSWKTDQVRL
ncbi:MAG: RNA methyltransferase, partial [Caulobacter sp.]